MVPKPTSQPPSLPPEAISHLHNGRMIEALKIVRQAEGLPLKEAKYRIDSYIQSQPSLRSVMAAKRTEAKVASVRWLVIVGCILAFGYLLAEML